MNYFTYCFTGANVLRWIGQIPWAANPSKWVSYRNQHFDQIHNEENTMIIFH